MFNSMSFPVRYREFCNKSLPSGEIIAIYAFVRLSLGILMVEVLLTSITTYTKLQQNLRDQG